MPSARKRRLRKLIKGALKAKDEVGGAITGDGSPSAQQAAMDSINALPLVDPEHGNTRGAALVTLLGLTTSAGEPTTSNPDSDGAQTGDDFLPFDGREVKDTDGDNIGDNRDILLTKEIMDGIFFEKKNGVDNTPLTGTLSTSISTQVSANAALSVVVEMPQGDAAEITAKKDALVALQGETVYTLTGLASLETKIVNEKNSVVSLKSQIAAMTADHDVRIDDAPFYDLAPYNAAGGSDTAKTDAAATDAVTPADAAKGVIDQMEINVAAIEAL